MSVDIGLYLAELLIHATIMREFSKTRKISKEQRVIIKWKSKMYANENQLVVHTTSTNGNNSFISKLLASIKVNDINSHVMFDTFLSEDTGEGSRIKPRGVEIIASTNSGIRNFLLLVVLRISLKIQNLLVVNSVLYECSLFHFECLTCLKRVPYNFRIRRAVNARLVTR